jgi:hypothetical protein
VETLRTGPHEQIVGAADNDEAGQDGDVTVADEADQRAAQDGGVGKQRGDNDAGSKGA